MPTRTTVKPPTTVESVEAMRTMAKVLRLTANYVKAQRDGDCELESVRAQLGRYANQASQEWRLIESFVRRHTGLSRYPSW